MTFKLLVGQKSTAALYFTIALLAIAAYASPWILHGEHSYVRIHDNLDSVMAWHVIMSENRFWFAPNMSHVGPIADTGLPRAVYPGELSIISLLFGTFEPYTAYVANQLLLRIVAFFGMWVFLASMVPLSRINLGIVFGVSLCYAFLPYWAWSGGAVSGLPWIFYVIKRLVSGHLGFSEILILAIYPFYSSIATTGIFLVLGLWIGVALAWWSQGSLRSFLVAATITSVFHFIADYRLFAFFVSDGFISHRVQFELPKESLISALRNGWHVFLHGDWMPSLHNFLITPLIGVTLAVSIVQGIAKKMRASETPQREIVKTADLRIIIYLTTLCLGISIFTGLWYWEFLVELREKLPFIKSINLTRINWILPCVWMISFAFVLFGIARKTAAAKYLIILLLIAAQLVYELSQHEYLIEKKASGITYSEFFSSKLFEKIEKSIPEDKSSYLVGSIGLHPSITQYNKFRTADGYLANYPLQYKERFREAIEDEFKKKKELKDYFDGWGSRFYFFSSEILCPRNGSDCANSRMLRPVISQLDFDMNAMRKLGVKYLFSIPVISNAEKIGLKELGTYSDKGSPWVITVYELSSKSLNHIE